METISDDILLNIFSHLDKRQLCAITRVNRRWARISCDQSFWKELNFKKFKVGYNGTFLAGFIPKRLVSLRRISLGAINISFNNLKLLWTTCKNLETIVFGRNSRLLKSRKRRTVCIPPKTKTLDLRLVKGDFEFLLASGGRFQSVENFGLGRGSYCLIMFPHLFCQTVNLKILDLTNCEHLTDDVMEDAFLRSSKLESLCLIGCRKLTGTFFPSLIEHCKNLKTLLVRYLPITDDVLCSCDWTQLPLEELDISACPDLTSIGLCALLSKLDRIRYLNMSYCGIGHAVTDAVLDKLSTHGAVDKLQMLDLRWSFLVSASSLRSFLTRCKDLQYLGIYQSNGVTSSVVSDVACYLSELRTIEFGGLRQEILTSSHMLQNLKEYCKNLSTLSLINFCSINQASDQKQFSDFIASARELKRVNLCDCVEDLVLAATDAASNTAVSITEKWECALPPPTYTLDSVTRKCER